MRSARLRRPIICLALLSVALVLGLGPARTAPAAQADSNVVVQITSPRPGERVTGTIEIAGYAADQRSTNGSGLNERDIQVYLGTRPEPQNLLGYAGAGRPSPEAVTVLGPQFGRVGFQRVWDTCTVPPGPHELTVWVSSLVVPGSGSFSGTDVIVEPCPPPAAPAAPAGPSAASPTGPDGPPPAAAAPPGGPAAPPPASAGAPPSAPSPAGAPAGPAPTGPGRVLLQDNFSDPTSGFQTQSPDPNNWQVTYEGGEYVVVKQARSTGQFAIAGRDNRGAFDDFAAEIDARIVPPLEGAYYFLIFRAQDGNNWYSFAVTPSNQTYALYRSVGGSVTNLTSVATSAAIQPGAARNRLGLRARGPEIVFSVNGQELGQVTDSTFASGFLTLGAGNGMGGRSEARFSNLVVTAAN